MSLVLGRMDLNKKVSLLKWFDALSVKSIKNFEDLRDVQVITDIMCTCDLLPEEVDLSSFEKRLAVVKTYLEGCYHQTFDDKMMIDFSILAGKVRGDVFELEMGKLLLALLGCGVQDKSRDRFIQPALDLDSESQINLTEMLQSLLLGDAMDMKLPDDFPDVLKRKSESSSHRDAALFFKLVADGARDSPQRSQGTPNPSNSFPANGRVVSLLFVLFIFLRHVKVTC
ncbi:uncharacterized protein LOC132720871 isoform X1 [Ruditapes philippinarum]|uniref:uncharacterized protein LOC132720871 isoform X1 n=1 Tax=Ruditapes philippinarum TaxID=129788 RepID=UPI00295B86D1|nr:uncharacterized protein LOC132720871 isoform X1 [Ruditapes philippinarum]